MIAISQTLRTSIRTTGDWHSDVRWAPTPEQLADDGRVDGIAAVAPEDAKAHLAAIDADTIASIIPDRTTRQTVFAGIHYICRETGDLMLGMGNVCRHVLEHSGRPVSLNRAYILVRSGQPIHGLHYSRAKAAQDARRRTGMG